MLRLTNLAQRAIVAHRVIQSIQSSTFPTNAQIVSMTNDQLNELNNSIKPMGEKFLLKQLATESSLEKQNSESVLNIFKYGHGLPLSSSIVSKYRNIRQGSSRSAINKLNFMHPSTQSLVFFPTSITTKLFNFIFGKEQKIIIYGMEGIGKSTSTLLFQHLSSMIIDFRVREKEDTIKSFVDMEQFTKTPKIIYCRFDTYLKQIATSLHSQSLQLNYPSDKFQKFMQQEKDEYSQKNKKNCENFIKEISSFMQHQYGKRGIRIKLVVDYDQNQLKGYQPTRFTVSGPHVKWDQFSKPFLRIQYNLQLLETCFKDITVLTNRETTTNLQQITKDFQSKYFPECKPRNLMSIEWKIKQLHNKHRLSQQYEQVEMDLIFWFQIQKNINKHGLLKEANLKQLYRVFIQNTKYLSGWESSEIIRKEPWQSHITHQKCRKTLRQVLQHLYYKVKFQEAQIQKGRKEDKYEYQQGLFQKYKPILKQSQQQYIEFLQKHYQIYRYPQERKKFIEICELIFKSARKQMNTGKEEYLYSNGFRLRKEGMFQKIVRSDQLKCFIDSGYISIDSDGYYVSLSPFVMVRGMQYFMEQLIKQYQLLAMI